MRRKPVLQMIVVAILGLLWQDTASTFPSVNVSEARDSVSVSPLKPLDVRTRRLHLVRPDLLHYPLQYDTYC